MSTRATYKIYDGYNNCYVYFYIHSSNHPPSAAFYFKNMLDSHSYCETRNETDYRYSYAKHFMKANDNAYFTKSHNYHVDTEYQYTIKPIKTGSRVLIAKDTYNDMIFYRGTIDRFINKYITTKYIKIE